MPRIGHKSGPCVQQCDFVMHKGRISGRVLLISFPSLCSPLQNRRFSRCLQVDQTSHNLNCWPVFEEVICFQNLFCYVELIQQYSKSHFLELVISVGCSSSYSGRRSIFNVGNNFIRKLIYELRINLQSCREDAGGNLLSLFLPQMFMVLVSFQTGH